MIPKVIHYCWFGRKPKPDSVLRYIKTWYDKMPDYEIKEWNEDNFDVNSLKFTKEAYALKKYAFVSDVARIYALYKEGGIYLDTDVEVKKDLLPLLVNKSFIGWEDILPGTAVLASEKNTEWLKDMLDFYKDRHFINWYGKLETTPNPYILAPVLKKYGLRLNHKKDVLKDNIAIYPIEFLCAHDMSKRKYIITENTYCIHHFDASWCSKNKPNILELFILYLNNLAVRIKLM